MLFTHTAKNTITFHLIHCRQFRRIGETKLSSFWRNFPLWLHRNLPFWQLTTLSAGNDKISTNEVFFISVIKYGRGAMEINYHSILAPGPFLLSQVTWERSQPMREYFTYITPSLIHQDHSHVTQVWISYSLEKWGFCSVLILGFWICLWRQCCWLQHFHITTVIRPTKQNVTGLILGLRPANEETALICNDVSYLLGASLESECGLTEEQKTTALTVTLYFI